MIMTHTSYRFLEYMLTHLYLFLFLHEGVGESHIKLLQLLVIYHLFIRSMLYTSFLYVRSVREVCTSFLYVHSVRGVMER